MTTLDAPYKVPMVPEWQRHDEYTSGTMLTEKEEKGRIGRLRLEKVVLEGGALRE